MFAFSKLLQFSSAYYSVYYCVWGPIFGACCSLLRMWMYTGDGVSRSPGRRSASTIFALGISGEQYFLEHKLDWVPQNSVVIQNSVGTTLETRRFHKAILMVQVWALTSRASLCNNEVLFLCDYFDCSISPTDFFLQSSSCYEARCLKNIFLQWSWVFRWTCMQVVRMYQNADQAEVQYTVSSLP